ncbi:hypothetical protein T01_8207 [Trichinella spiralis]|uniref:Uncharacterized protein n=1 Tax=Trichinella spiralis TaxID=6334 RepID=A0A0V1AR89_TRISP|nr:hypothetical protein T01_8207 [Trichinella spiralis]
MQITIAITRLIISKGAFKEWSKENVKTRTTRNRTREGNRLGTTSSLEQHQRHLPTQPTCGGVF